MSGENTKAQKIDRILQRQLILNRNELAIVESLKEFHKIDRATIALQAATIEKLTAANLELTATNTLLATVAQSQEEQLNRQEGQLDRIRKYVGSILFKRRQLMAGTASRIPTLHDAQEPKWGGKSGLEHHELPARFSR